MHDLDIEMPTSVAVDPEAGVLYWSDAGKNPRIETSWLDGSRRQTILSAKNRVISPGGLVVDYVSADRRIYWVDPKLNTIESARPDGTARLVIKNREFNVLSMADALLRVSVEIQKR